MCARGGEFAVLRVDGYNGGVDDNAAREDDHGVAEPETEQG